MGIWKRLVAEWDDANRYNPYYKKHTKKQNAKIKKKISKGHGF